ncbi:MAG: hypothetical protein AAGM22_11015 [Acidobacteriota bacterium]
MSAAEAQVAAQATFAPEPSNVDPADLVLRCDEVGFAPLEALLERYGLELVRIEDGSPIPGSYWKESEAGMVGHRLYARRDTPVHSLLHETCHVICMDAERRAVLDTEAGGEDVEENAVCYLQLLLADRVPGFGFDRAVLDMDRWGYSFRLGSARAWFEADAEDARAFLLRHGLLAPGTPGPDGDPGPDGAPGPDIVVFRLRR